MDDLMLAEMLGCALIAEGILFVIVGIAISFVYREDRKLFRRKRSRNFDLRD